MKFILKMIFLSFLASCMVIAINENDYSRLMKNDFNYLKSFDIKQTECESTNPDSVFLFEINSDNIKECAKKYDYLWLHLWRPYCSGEYCQNLNYFSNIEDSYSQRGYNFKFLLISETYGLPDIRKSLAHSYYDKPIFVLQDSYYGHKLKPNRVKLFEDLNNNPGIKYSEFGSDDYIFVLNQLIFTGNDLTRERIDSLIEN